MSVPTIQPDSVPQKSFEDVVINFAPKGMSEEEQRRLLRQDVRRDFHRISQALEDFHGVFYQLWEMGYPHLTFEVPTAAVKFDKEGNNTEFLFGPIAWQKLDMYTKAFVISHECLHVMLNHGVRTKDCPIPRLANIALDIVVNHMLVTKFGFSRASLDLSPLVEGILDENGKQIPHKNDRGDDTVLCWIDTVFGSTQGKVKRNKPFEYYYALLEENIIIMEGPGDGLWIKLPGEGGGGKGEKSGGQVLDDHNFLKDFGDKDVQERIAEEINDKLTDEEKEDFNKKVLKTEEGKAAEKSTEESSKDGGSPGGKHAGTIAGRIKYRPLGTHYKKQKKWETVIKKWSRRYLREDTTVEQWAKKNRRMHSFTMDRELIMPSDIESEGKDLQRIDVLFYQDFSGSCVHLKDRFFKAAQTLPVDRFNVKMFCFDTGISPVDPKDPELKGGGGTSFSVIEDHIQLMIRDGKIKSYPSIFIITDGYGSAVNPQFPELWYWFLSENYTHYIPEKSNKFMLNDFE